MSFYQLFHQFLLFGWLRYPALNASICLLQLQILPLSCVFQIRCHHIVGFKMHKHSHTHSITLYCERWHVLVHKIKLLCKKTPCIQMHFFIFSTFNAMHMCAMNMTEIHSVTYVLNKVFVNR